MFCSNEQPPLPFRSFLFGVGEGVDRHIDILVLVTLDFACSIFQLDIHTTLRVMKNFLS